MDPHSPENIQLMPRDTQSEARLLNYLITNDSESKRQACQSICQGQLDPWAFFHEPHRLIFLAIRALYQQGLSVCSDNITDWLFSNTRPDLQKVIDMYMLRLDSRPRDAPGMSADERLSTIRTHVMKAATCIPPDQNYPGDPLLTHEDVLTVMDSLSVLNVSRKVILHIEKLKHLAYRHDPMFMDELGDSLTQMEQLLVSRGNQLVSARDVLLSVIQQARDNQDPTKRRQPVLTPFRLLNEVGGLPEAGMFLIAGDTGTGKTSLALNFAACNVLNGLKVGYLNLEMPNSEMGERIMAGALGIRLKALEYEQLSPEQMQLLETRGVEVAEAARDLYFENTAPRRKEDFMMMLRRMASQGCKVAYIDYMQILSWSTRESHRDMTTQDMLAEIAREVHQEALKLRMLVIVLSQVNRDRDYSELTLERIRDSKQIADAAMGVLLINRPELYGKGFESEEFRNVNARGKGLFYLAKNRNGERAKFLVEFVGSRFTYQDLNDNETRACTRGTECNNDNESVTASHPVFQQSATAPVIDEDDLVNW